MDKDVEFVETGDLPDEVGDANRETSGRRYTTVVPSTVAPPKVIPR